MALARARNEIVHEGRLTSSTFEAPEERPLSRYGGELFGTADRLLREAIKAMLGVKILLCGTIDCNTDGAEEAHDGAQLTINPLEFDIETAAPDTTDWSSCNRDQDVSPEPSVASATDERSLQALLKELRCDAANRVRLARTEPNLMRTSEHAAVDARPASARWVALFRGREISINRVERNILVQEGAEFSLPSYWTPCE